MILSVMTEIQRTIQEKLKERGAERERNITKRMKQYDQKYDFMRGSINISNFKPKVVILEILLVK